MFAPWNGHIALTLRFGLLHVLEMSIFSTLQLSEMLGRHLVDLIGMRRLHRRKWIRVLFLFVHLSPNIQQNSAWAAPPSNLITSSLARWIFIPGQFPGRLLYVLACRFQHERFQPSIITAWSASPKCTVTEEQSHIITLPVPWGHERHSPTLQCVCGLRDPSLVISAAIPWDSHG